MVRVCSVAVRVLEFFANFIVCAANLGLRTALSVFIAGRFSTTPRQVYLRGFGRSFTYRGYADKGVMSHFYRPGYRIVDTPQHSIQVIIDAGANIGDETVRFRYFYPQAKIIAVEVESNNFRILQSNLKYDSDVICINSGLWWRSAKLEVIQSDHNEGFSVIEIPDFSSNPGISALSINDIINLYDITNIDILKLDIEGTEFELFSHGTHNWIDVVSAFIIECADHERPGTMSKMFEALGHKFDCYIHGENLVFIRRSTGWRLTTSRFL